MKPCLIKTPEEFAARAAQYFRLCEERGEQLSITGLCLGIGLSSRASLADYEQREGFAEVVQRARLVVEHAYERALMSGHCVGAIFSLKNLGWIDERSVKAEVTGEGAAIARNLFAEILASARPKEPKFLPGVEDEGDGGA